MLPSWKPFPPTCPPGVHEGVYRALDPSRALNADERLAELDLLLHTIDASPSVVFAIMHLPHGDAESLDAMIRVHQIVRQHLGNKYPWRLNGTRDPETKVFMSVLLRLLSAKPAALSADDREQLAFAVDRHCEFLALESPNSELTEPTCELAKRLRDQWLDVQAPAARRGILGLLARR